MLKGHGAPNTGVVGNVGDLFEDLDTGKIYKLATIVLKEKQMGFVTIPEYVCETNQYVWVPVAGEGGGSGADFGIVKTPTSDSIVEGTFTVVDGQITDQNWSGIAGENHVSKTYIVTINGELYHAKVVDGQNYSGQGYSGGAVLKVMSVGENSSILAYGECLGAGYAPETVNRAYSMEDGTYEITFQEGTVEIKTIDPLYLPKSGELYQASGETVTASEFNALLNSLADAGYIKLSVGL